MPATPASSTPSSVRLTPVACEPDWRIATLTAGLAVTSGLLLVLIPPSAILPPIFLLLLLAAVAFGRARRECVPEAIRLCADGRATVVVDRCELPVTLGASGIFGNDIALIRWRVGRRNGPGGWTLVLRRDNRAAWSRARRIWRWAPRGASPPFV